jgi:hypothetical protein
MGLPRESYPRELVLQGDHDIWIRLVVTQSDVVGRAVLLDEVVLQQ